MSQVTFHPAAKIFPMLDPEDLDRLAEDIKANGLKVPIVLVGDQILDGRNRYMACRRAGVEPAFVQHDGSNPWRFVWSLNKERRHITDKQRVVLIGEEMVRGSDKWESEREKAKAETSKARSDAAKKQHATSNPRAGEKSGAASHEARPDPKRKESHRLAEELGVSRSTVERALELKRKDPVLAQSVMDGEVEGSKALREVKRKERVAKLVEISSSNTKLDGSLGRYPVIYADPPWRYDDNSTDPTRVIENQYPTMSIEDICSLPVPEVCTDDAILFLWATSPLLHKAIEVVAAWGFSYKTCAVWDKEKIGMGYFFRQQHELLLVAERGSMPKPPSAARPSSVFRESRGAHSSKPVRFYEIIETMYPELPRLELFCRSPRDGWKAWGNQAA